jgi:non-ribosomal peptide synthetase component F
MVENDGRFIGNWLYSTDLFDRATILRIAGHFAALLQSAVAQPNWRLSALEILSEDEKIQRGSQTKERKQSQLKKLITVAPKAVTLSLADKDGKE